MEVEENEVICTDLNDCTKAEEIRTNMYVPLDMVNNISIIENSPNVNKPDLECQNDGIVQITESSVNNLQDESKVESVIADYVAKEVVVPNKKKKGYTCLICSRKFNQNAGRYNHMRNVHKMCLGDRTNVRCLEKNCKFTCSYKEKLQSHLSTCHGIDMALTMKSFESFQDFLRWKDDFERHDKSRFVKKSGSRVRAQVGIRVAYYYCSRSGTFVSHGTGIKNTKKKGTSKTNNHCTASITCVEMPDGKVEVKICSTHYGHDTDLHHLRLTQTEKFEIANQLSKGVPRDLILDNVRSSAGPEVDRIHLITLKDVKNIEKAFKIPATSQEKTSNMFYNLTEWIKNIMQTEHCPVLYFKEDGTFNNKNHCLTLILLTTGQLEVLNRHGENGIYYVTTSVALNKQLLSNYPFRLSIYLTSLILVDDLNEAIPVSFMLSNHCDTDRYTLFFQSLKRKVPKMSAKSIITDDKNEIYQVWRDVFEEEPCYLWSNRFVDSEWRENLISIPDEELQVAIYEKLYSYLESRDQTKLETTLESYVYELQTNEVTSSFGSYFASRFLGTETLWAGCYDKRNVSISAQLNMENLYNEIGETGQRRHWDRNYIVRIVQNLLKLVSDKQCIRQTRLQRQLQEISTHHDLALNIKPETISQLNSDSCWRIDSVKDPVNIYSIVSKTQESCDPTLCMLYCTKCNACMHQFICTCKVHTYDKTMCKHIHAVAVRFFSKMEELVNDMPSAASTVDLLPDSTPSGAEGNAEPPLASPLTDESIPVVEHIEKRRRKAVRKKHQDTTNEDNILEVLEAVIRNTQPCEKRKRGRPRKSEMKQDKCDENKIKSSMQKPRGQKGNKSTQVVTEPSEDISSYSSTNLRPHKINILRKFKKLSP